MVQRVTYRRRLSYNTKSNKTQIFRAPGGQLRLKYVGKRGKHAKCGVSGVLIKATTATRPANRQRQHSAKRKISRAYGGVYSARSVKQRIIRAFLNEEENIVVRVLKAQAKTQGKAAKK
uniref:Large ribosomal subunit protein eL34 n=1 Tax=Pectinaria gouldii TaxID=260746 RepID=A0A0K1R040_PECGU|nr:60S ribosomal protein L34 [Pectinaria gouldii]